MIISLLLGILVGAVLGLTGAGGGILAVPALVFGLGWTMQAAAPVALIAVAGGAAVGAVEGLQRGLVRYRAALLMVAFGVPFTWCGIYVAHELPQRWLISLFSAVMLFVAYRFLTRSQASTNDSTSENRLLLAHINPQSGRFQWTPTATLFLACLGALSGFMTGLLGVGGGFVIVPMMRRFTNVNMHGIVATSLMVIALVGSGGIISAMSKGAHIPFTATTLFALATGSGMLAGRKLASHIAEHHIQRSFGILLIIVASILAFRAIYAS